MRLADKLGMPIITFLDTAGAFPGPAAEERGQAEAIATSIKLMTALQVPIVVIVLGEGGSGGALAIGVGDVVLALENAVYSVISPEGASSILWRSRDEARTRGGRDAHDGRRPGHARGGRRDRRRAWRWRAYRSRRDWAGAEGGHPVVAPRACRPRDGRSAHDPLCSAPRPGRLPGYRVGLRRPAQRAVAAPGALDGSSTFGVPPRPRWSDIWPSSDSDDDSERGA